MEILAYPFFLRALAAGIMTAVTCGIVGTYIVTKRIAFIGGGITHASFGGIGMGYFFGFNPLAGAGIFAVISALSVRFFSRKGELREDTMIGILWSFGMALGIVFIYLTPGFAPDLTGFLFGSILTVSQNELYIMAAVMAVVIIFFVIFYNHILCMAFDEEFAGSQKSPVDLINYSVMVIIALTIMIGIRAAGVIMVISLLTIPQAAAGYLTGNFRMIIYYSILFAVAAFITGLFFAYFFNVPSGAAIIICQVCFFIIVKFSVTIVSILRLKSRMSGR